MNGDRLRDVGGDCPHISVIHGCFKGNSRVFQEFFRVFQENFKIDQGFQACFKIFLISGCFKTDLMMSQGRSKGAPMAF